MREILTTLGLAMLLAAGNVAAANIEEEQNVLLELDRAWAESTKDLEKFLSFYAPDASVYPPGMPVVNGSTAIRQTLTEIFSTPGFSLHFTCTKAVVSSSGDIGYTVGYTEMTLNDSAGNPVTEKGKYVTLWKKQAGGQWKVVEDIFNADTPPPSELSASPKQ